MWKLNRQLCCRFPWEYTRTNLIENYYKFASTQHTIGHDLGQRVKIIQKRNRWADLKILSWKVSFCGFMESQERILQLDHFCSHWSIKLLMKFFAPIMRYRELSERKEYCDSLVLIYSYISSFNKPICKGHQFLFAKTVHEPKSSVLPPCSKWLVPSKTIFITLNNISLFFCLFFRRIAKPNGCDSGRGTVLWPASSPLSRAFSIPRLC